MKATITFPRYTIEKINGTWEVYDTKEAVVLNYDRTLHTYDEAKQYLKDHEKQNDNQTANRQVSDHRV